ncbi:hypothetical protein ADICYQ_3171 [Cyclobacterium qasimii M12-11B]|uniref:Uncharacterized protein n=1 Tax=Cyclobacterium qasimii M12-11B TaxID=641524 RepID=S7VC08_9BACT|nr:hypothetical protein ADICYQ_3171 [Cyclobacterium qasimii M12-11B]
MYAIDKGAINYYQYTATLEYTQVFLKPITVSYMKNTN